MVIVNSKIGQLANRLFHFSYFLANAYENDYKLVFWFFQEYRAYFNIEEKVSDIGVKLHFGQSFINRFFSKSLRSLRPLLDHLGIVHYQVSDSHGWINLSTKDFVTKAKNNIVVVEGWQFQDVQNLQRHRSKLIELLRPKSIFQEQVSLLVDPVKEAYDLIIGVHVRKGDYKEWQGGLYYYEEEVYARLMKNMLEQLEGKVIFLVCSDGDLRTDCFEGLPVLYDKRHFIVDLYALAECDYIIGPPSTFSMWASFCGNVPLYHIEDPKMNFKLDQFSIDLYARDNT